MQSQIMNYISAVFVIAFREVLYMRALAYSVLFIAMFYIVGIVCEISGLKDGKAGIYMLVGIMVVLGFFIAGKNGKK